MATSRCTIDQVNKSFKHHLLLKNYKKIIPKYVLGTALEIDSKKVRGLGSGVAQLVEHLLLIPEIRGSNPVIGKKLY